MDSSQIGGNSVVSWSAECVATNVNDEIVLMNMQRNRCYGLGSTGSSLWRLLGTPARLRDVAAQLAEEYDAPQEIIEQDVLNTARELCSEGLLQIHEI
jgi:Coenzyme PQQ synthesis protein D (PqqD)